MLTIVRVALLFCVAASLLRAQAGDTTAVIRGKVVDFKTGEAIAKARVAVREQAREAVTGEDGRFELAAVQPGSVELQVTTVGYGVLKKRMEAPAGQVAEVELLIGQEALKHSDQVTVTAGPFAPVASEAAIEYTLNNTEIRNLSTVLADDPLRAVHNLPGVAAAQDFYAQFAVRGAGMSHIGVFYDGVLLDQPFHAVRDQGDLGSLSIVNGDVVESTALLSGAFPARFDDRTGAMLEIQSREPGRQRFSGRLNADFLGASATVEGPISRKGSVLLSVRKSYLEYLLSRLGASGALALGYEDVQSKAVYDLAPRLRASATLVWGGAQVKRDPVTFLNLAENFFTRATSRDALATLRLNWIPTARTLIQTQGFWSAVKERDDNPSGVPLFHPDSKQTGYRQDITWQSGVFRIAGGVLARRVSQDDTELSTFNLFIRYVTPEPHQIARYQQVSWHTGSYIQNSVSLLHQRLTLQFGGRWDRSTVICRNAWQPQASLTFSLFPKTRLAIAGGRYAQFPTARQSGGAFGAELRAERASHAVVSLDQFVTERMRVHVEAYERRERSLIYSPATEFRALPDGRFVWPDIGQTYNNSLRGYARGVEISLQRRSANRFSGWLSYSRSYSKYWQPGTDLSFWGDFDSRNTVSAYAHTRLTPTISVAANARYGTGMPIPGFLEGPLKDNLYNTELLAFRLSPRRNTSRMPSYQRIDCRVNKVVARDRFTLTLYGEVANVTNHANWRYYGLLMPPWVQYEGLVGMYRNKTMPVLPAAGVTFEF